MPAQMGNEEFERLLAKHQEAYAKAEAFNSWNPPDGEYVVQVEDVTYEAGTDQKTRDDTFAWKMKCIIDEEDQTEYAGSVFTIRLSSYAWGALKPAVAVLNGGPIDKNLIKAHGVLLNTPGLILRVAIKRGVSKKTGNEYVRQDILSVLGRVEDVVPEEQETATEIPSEASAE